MEAALRRRYAPPPARPRPAPRPAPATTPRRLRVAEPFDLTNAARSVYDPDTFERIVSTFRDSYRRLSAGLRLGDAWPQR